MAKTLVLSLLIGLVHAQSYSGCHTHGSIEYCYGSDGNETPVSTLIPATATIPATTTASTTASAHSSAVTGCHSHGDEVFCIDDHGHEVQVSLASTPTGELPAQYTGCHSHDGATYCMDPEGNDVKILEESAKIHSESESSGQASKEGMNCHFHAGVEHCVGAGESESGSAHGKSCGLRERDYDVPLRVGTLFVVLVTSSIGVFLPMALVKLPSKTLNGVLSTAIKQFGTGVILSTAFVHLYTHANLMFTNDCLGELDYEATTSAVVLAGIFLSFLFEYIGHRLILARGAKSCAANTCPSPPSSTKEPTPHHHTLTSLGHNHGPALDPTHANTQLSVLVMEAGVIFHSILIGLTLVVAGDSFYKTLLVVIIFHQFFEGLALGARIALLPGRVFPHKAVMAGAFAVITPVGMAIGLGVLHSFNGNEKSTLVALGTLDALSAGILVWVGVVDMWARDWVMEGGEMMDAKLGRVLIGGVALVAGMVLMGVLGKWA
ncbi:putative ZIP Zinc transporter [Aspergillus clavatus NRRL 1]|uniref:ZIP Zinc transporter, putative n=1 Tax=Aspergillus clavatus (strain ATCC 1007 / CBS 513.65 / DSM 816 / NCTC 3887 / NRRL 1 / QM 1276 / 107) TaxID=344612 RepID=A1CHQ8_ASPCL|nr:ZIP Zinc transporter, putative [Aspergillus clavatus NRRL 1]EAW10413.1 ZIP Zinc transporter, putative [Aspergillus clavatus NRRL 1]